MSELEEFRTHLLEERHRAKEAAQAFIRVCADDGADKLYSASLWLDEAADDLGVSRWKGSQSYTA
jgi:hypothetical protein